MDIRDLTAGVTLYLPIEVEGALFSIGDTHAAQGDGEVCGTAIESPMSVTVRFDLVKGENGAQLMIQSGDEIVRARVRTQVRKSR